MTRSAPGLLSLLAAAACASSSSSPGDGAALPVDGAALPADGATDATVERLVIVQNQMPRTTQCVLTSALGDRGSERGTYDVSLDREYPYLLFPLVHVPPSQGQSGRSQRVMVMSWSVRIVGPSETAIPWPAACPSEFQFPFITSVEPGGHSPAAIQGLLPCHGEVLRRLFKEGTLPASHAATVLLRLQVRARGDGAGGSVESGWFDQPVRVCYGCLQIDYPDPAYADYAFPRIPLCDKLTANPYPGNPCNPAQEPGPVLCCARDPEGRQLQCPAMPGVPDGGS